MNFYEFINRRELKEIREIKSFIRQANRTCEGPFELAFDHSQNEVYV